MIDWGIGHYEKTASELEPAAEHVVSLARLQPGERVLDLATGTGNAALLAARLGAVVTGLDAAPRLIGVARERADGEDLDASFVVGNVEALPFESAAFDVALSVFGLIFAGDPDRAFGEMMRVLRADGRALLSVWVPAGPIDAVVGVIGRAMAAATGSTPDRFAWHDPDAVRALAARHDAEIQVYDAKLTITGESPEAHFATNEEMHPMSIAGRPVLERAGTYSGVREQALAILREANEDPQAFRVSSPYRVIEVHPSS